MDQLTSGRSGLVWSGLSQRFCRPPQVQSPRLLGSPVKFWSHLRRRSFQHHSRPLQVHTQIQYQYRRLAGPRSTLHASQETRRACASILSMLALCLYTPPRHEYLLPSFCRSRYMDSLCGYAVEVPTHGTQLPVAATPYGCRYRRVCSPPSGRARAANPPQTTPCPP
ncbi:hypothetical protein HDV62DRAFT_161354 [Trichoderma sp. SZMC 28011]